MSKQVFKATISNFILYTIVYDRRKSYISKTALFRPLKQHSFLYDVLKIWIVERNQVQQTQSLPLRQLAVNLHCGEMKSKTLSVSVVISSQSCKILTI